MEKPAFSAASQFPSCHDLCHGFNGNSMDLGLDLPM